jgi:hypothetical protein
MKHSYRWMVVCACVVAGGVAAGLELRFFMAAARSQAQVEMASELDPSDPRYKEVMCGPASLSVALGRLGIGKLAADIASQCKVTPRGVGLPDLERDANSTRLVSARARQMGWDELNRLDGVAVLFVKGNHYLVADPRKLDGIGEADKVRIYDTHLPVQWWTREKLDEIWRGEAIEITRRAARVDETQSGACIYWDECYLDHGVFPRGTAFARYKFSFRNVGSSDLVIGDIQRSCGCTEHILSQDRVAPGESAVIELSVDLSRTDGYFQHYVVVKTNDATSPASILRMAGGVPRARVTSSDVIRLEDLPQGGEASQTFFVADPGFSGFKIREARFVPHDTSKIGDHLSCLISFNLLGDESRRVPAGFRAKPSDYGVRIAFEARSGCPLGPFQGEVNVVLDADGVVTTQKVVLEGTIVQDVHSVPRLALITLNPESAGEATIQLQRHSKKVIGVVRTWSDSPNSLKIRPKGEAQATSSEFIITAQVSDIIAGAAPLQRAVSFELSDGSVVSVPVALFRPPQ